jgi:hypothetical protein
VKQRQAREQEAGMLELFGDDLVVKPKCGSPYLHIPPTTPWSAPR